MAKKKETPSMTLEQFEARKHQLINEQEQVKATIALYEGAIQDCNYWIEQLSKKDTEE